MSTYFNERNLISFKEIYPVWSSHEINFNPLRDEMGIKKTLLCDYHW